MHLRAHSNLEPCEICDSIECNKELYIELVNAVLKAISSANGIKPTAADDILRGIIGNQKILSLLWDLVPSDSTAISWCETTWTKED